MVMQEQGWQSTKSQTTTLSELASNSQEAASVQKPESKEQPKQEEQKQEPVQPKDKDYFNTILADSEKESNSWENFFGLNDSTSVAGIDPIVNLVSTLFAGLMAMAVQIDNMGNAVTMQQSSQEAQSVDANALAAQNFDNAMNSSINNPIKRTRS
jgi:hypothetical protein